MRWNSSTCAEVDDRRQLAQMLGHPEADVGGAGQQGGNGDGRRRSRGELIELRGATKPAAEREDGAQRRIAAQRAQRFRPRTARSSGAARSSPMRRASVDDRRYPVQRHRLPDSVSSISGASVCAAPYVAGRGQTATSRSPACRSRTASHGMSTIACCTGCSEPSRLLQAFHGKQCLAVERGQEPDAGIDRALQSGASAPVRVRRCTTVQAPQSPSAQPSLVPVRPGVPAGAAARFGWARTSGDAMRLQPR